MIILGIETSCDETSAAVVKADRGGVHPVEYSSKTGITFCDAKSLFHGVSIVSNVVSSQIDIHKEYGGVVPEVAAREHVKNILWVIDEALKNAKVDSQQIDLIAVASGPGLITSLIVGTEAAKTLSLAWQKPIVSVNHMYAHIAGNFLNKIEFPALALVVSGGHTELVLLKDYWNFKKIGQTLDDAAGEAFDKVAKLLGLGYPGGPIISAKAEMSQKSKVVKFIKSIDLPRPMLKKDNFDFSFSGLKTAVLYDFKKRSDKAKKSKEYIETMCYEFQQAAVDVLVSKTIKAAKKYNVKTVMMAGGVAANKKLRETLGSKVKDMGLEFLVPEFKLCTDNAAIIALAGYYLSQKKKPKVEDFKNIKADPGWEL